jgi:uncharacterized RDD family membrane protein YckC
VTTPAGSRRDRTSRVVAILILAAIIVPVLWLVLSAALGGPTSLDPEMEPNMVPRAPTTTYSPSGTP